MVSQQLTKRQEALIKSLHTRHGRKKQRLCLCEGVRCCRELLRLRPELVRYAICTESFEDDSFEQLDLIRLPEKRFQTLAPTQHSQGILLVAEMPPEPSMPEQLDDPFVVVLDQVGDPGNLGTICRTVKAIGLHEIWLTHGSVDPFSDKVIRSSLACQFGLIIRRFQTIDEVIKNLLKLGYANIYRTTPHTGMSCYSEAFKLEKAAVLFGSEAHGLGELPHTEAVTIDMPGAVESLNLAQAATVILFEHVRRQK